MFFFKKKPRSQMLCKRIKLKYIKSHQFFLTIHPDHTLLQAGCLGCIVYLLRTDLSFYWSANIGPSMYRNPLENVTYAFDFASPAVTCMCYLTYLNGMWDGRSVSVQLLFCGVLHPGFVQEHITFLDSFYKAFSLCFASFYMMQPYCSIDISTAWKKYHFYFIG